MNVEWIKMLPKATYNMVPASNILKKDKSTETAKTWMVFMGLIRDN